MAVPDYQTLMALTLHALSDGAEHPISQLQGTIAQRVGLTDEDLKATLPSGSRLFVNRLHWTITYLYQDGLVRRPRRAVVQIIRRGLDVLAEHPDRVDNSILLQFKEFIEFQSGSRGDASPAQTDAQEPAAPAETTPVETIATAVAEANSAIAAEVLERVREREPAFLEQLVLNVLTALGYRGAAGSAEHLGRSGDNGLDGVIRQDPLGLDQIYVQAKRYAAAHAVGRPEIQGFVGALHGAQAFRATGPEGARGYAQTLTVGGKSVQKEVQQRKRTITHIYDPRHHELAAELGRSSDAPVVRIEVVGPSGAAGVLAARTTADKISSAQATDQAT